MCGPKKIPYKYSDVESHDGWIDSQKYLPKEYDLCLLKTPDKTLRGWYTGTMWDGLTIKESDTVLFWKRVKEQ